jgi:DNA-binding Lrp family transcriptional regulator
MKADGTITRIVAELDPMKMGVPVTIVTTVRFERDSYEHTNALVTRLRARPEVQLLHVLTGQHDLLIVRHRR